MIKVIIRTSPNQECYTAEVNEPAFKIKTSNNFHRQSALSELDSEMIKVAKKSLFDQEFIVIHE